MYLSVLVPRELLPATVYTTFILYKFMLVPPVLVVIANLVEFALALNAERSS